MTLATNWVDGIGMFVNAAYLNQNGSETNANTAARPQYGTRSAMPAAAPENNGAQYYCTDCDAVYQSNGTQWTKIRVGGQAAPGIADPPSTGWSTVNLSTDMFANHLDGALLTTASAGSDNWRLRVRPLSPSSNYTAQFYLDPSFVDAGTWRSGIVLRNSSSGSFVALYFLRSSGSYSVTVDKWTAAGTFGSTYVTSGVFNSVPRWLRFRDDGTNRYAEYSYNAVEWITAHSVGRTDFITPDQIGWGASNTSTTKTGYLRLRSLNGVT